MKPNRLFLSPPHMGGMELDYVHEAFSSNYIAPLGPMVDAFEKAFAARVGIRHAVALSSGTAAIHLGLRHLGVGPGDEVLASTLTFVGSVSPIVFLGACPVFIDSDRSSWNMDPDLLEAELNRCRQRDRLPKAVVPTDLYGQSADLGRILKICDAYGVPVLADSAEALGATRNGRHAGAGARAITFSFNGNKIITTSGGGMLCSDDKGLIENVRYLSQQARQDAPHYEHTEIGYNYRMSNLLAAVGMGQLRVLDKRIRRKREIFAQYKSAFTGVPGISFMPEAPFGHCTRWLTVALIDPDVFGTDRETVRLILEEENIESRPVWKPMHQQPAFCIGRTAEELDAVPASYSNWPARQVGGKVADDLFDRGLCLPSGTAMTDEDVERVVDIIKGCRGAGLHLDAAVA